jgi:hypothetical protein
MYVTLSSPILVFLRAILGKLGVLHTGPTLVNEALWEVLPSFDILQDNG